MFKTSINGLDFAILNKSSIVYGLIATKRKEFKKKIQKTVEKFEAK